MGYTGGNNAHATYRNHPGHAEAVEIIYDPAQTDYRELLDFFFQIHDPMTKDRQGNDIGRSYRSAILQHQDYLLRIPNGYNCHYPRPGWKLPRRETV